MQEKTGYSTAYIAKRLGVTIPTVQRWVDAGRLTGWKTMGGHRRVDIESAEALFRQHEAEVARGALDRLINVVIVDDSPDDRDILEAMVEAHVPNARITTAENGYEGLVAIGHIAPDLVITDVVMPKMDGLELITQLLRQGRIKPPAIVVATSLSLDQVQEQGPLPAGVGYVRKPLEEQKVAVELQTALRSALGNMAINRLQLG